MKTEPGEPNALTSYVSRPPGFRRSHWAFLAPCYKYEIQLSFRLYQPFRRHHHRYDQR